MDGMETSVPQNPYVGPRAIKSGEAFFGREREIRSLSALLVAERIVLLHSPSGAGKSSLIQAGLAPRMAERFNVLPVIRVNLEPPAEVLDVAGLNRYTLSTILSLEEGLPPEKRLPLREAAAFGLEAYLEQRLLPDTEHENCLLIFDQFEEILTISPTDAPLKQAFFERLGEALQNRRRWALFAIREDYMGGLAPYLRAIPNRLNVTFRLELLGPEAAKLAIQQPAKNAGVDFKDETAQKLVDDLRRIQVQQSDGSFKMEEGPSIEPVQLQVVCYNLWQAGAAEDHIIDDSDLQRVGSVDQALASFYANAVSSVAESAQVDERILRQWFDQNLITLEGIRSQVLKGAEVTEGLPNQALRLLENTHLIRGESRAGKTWYELSHDRLVNPVRQDNAGWFEKNLSLLQRRSILWNQQGHSESLLLRNKELQQAEKESKTTLLTPEEQVYLAACRKLRSQQKLRRAAVTGLVGFSIVTLGLLIFALVQLNISRALQLGFQAETALAEQNYNAAGLYAYQSSQFYKNDPADLVLGRLPYENFPVGKRMEGHTGSVEMVSWSKDGRLASIDQNGNIILWNTSTGKPVYKINEDQYGGTTLAFAPDGRLATSSLLEIQIWNADNGQILDRLKIPQTVDCLAWSEDNRLAAGSRDGTVMVWDFSTGQNAQVLKESTAFVDSIAWSKDGRLASGDRDGNIIIWDLAAGKPAQKLSVLSDEIPQVTGGISYVESLAWSKDGRLASGDWNSGVIIWDLETGKPAQILNEGYHSVLSVAWSDNGRLASDSNNNTVVIWDLETGLPAQILRGHSDTITSLEWSPDGRLASGSYNSLVIIWDVSVQKPANILIGHSDSVVDLDWSSTGNLASASSDNTVIIWDIYTGKPAQVLKGHTDDVCCVAWASDGRLASGSKDKTVIIWDLSKNEPSQILAGHTQAVFLVSWLLDGRLVSSSADETIIWDLTKNHPEQIIRNGFRVVNGWLVSSNYDTINILDSSTYQSTKVLSGYPHEVNDLAGSFDGRFAVSYSNSISSVESTIIIWDLAAGKPEITLPRKVGSLVGMAWSKDGRLASAHDYPPNSSYQVIIWDLAKSQPSLTLRGHSKWIYDLAWSTDGYLASASGDKTIRIAPPNLLGNPCDWINRNMTIDEWLKYQGVLYVYRPACPGLPVPKFDPAYDLSTLWKEISTANETDWIIFSDRWFETFKTLLITWNGRFIALGIVLTVCIVFIGLIWLFRLLVKIAVNLLNPGKARQRQYSHNPEE